MKIMMIASVDPTVPNACLVHLDGVATALGKAGHAVRLVLPSAQDPAKAVIRGGPHYQVTALDFGRSLGIPRFLSLLIQAPRLVALCRREQIDLVYIRSAVLSWPLIGLLRLLWRGPIVAEHNGWLADELKVNGLGRVVQGLGWLSQRLDAGLATVVRCVTSGLARKFVEAGINSDKLVVIGNGTSTERFHPMPRAEALAACDLAEDGSFYLGFIGSLARWHGLHIAVRALPAILQAHPEVRLLIAGDGAERAPNEALTRELGIADRVSFLGYVPMERANPVINCFDLALAPFITERNATIGTSALKIRDYAAAGRAMLATEIPGIAEPDERDWLAICAPDDVDAYAAGVIRLIEDPAERARLAAAARVHAERRFDWSAVAAAILARVPPSSAR